MFSVSFTVQKKGGIKRMKEIKIQHNFAILAYKLFTNLFPCSSSLSVLVYYEGA
jgi:hypothetical protein